MAGPGRPPTAPVMPLLPMLPLLPEKPRTAPTAAVRLSARGMPGGVCHGFTPGSARLVQASDRQMLKPDVGEGQMISALGSIRPMWETSRPASQQKARPPASGRSMQGQGGYHVGRARARRQLRVAMDTQGEEAQLRRIMQALGTPTVQYEQSWLPGLNNVVRQAAVLSGRIKDPTRTSDAGPMPCQLLLCAGVSVPVATRATSSAAQDDLKKKKKADELEELAKEQEAQEALGATRIQAVFRGKKDRAEVEQKRQEKTAAVKIQARYRGKDARRTTAKLLQNQYAGLAEQENIDLNAAEVEGEEGLEEETQN